MSKKVYYITEFSDPKDQFKFQAQIENIFDEKGFVAISYPKNYLLRFLALFRLFFRLKKGAVIFFIHPLYSRTSKFILRIAALNKCFPVCIVSDINSLRDENISLDKEINYWKRIKYFIFHNDKMRSLVEAKVGKKVSVNIPLFDLLFQPPAVERKNGNEVSFAGNIEKCPFISDLVKVQDIEWHVYSASKITAALPVKYTRLNDDVTDRTVLQGSYGLIWEGESIENINGYKGKYLEWVNPLKLSNYLLNSLPVITHKNAAIANFVVQNNIGFCVSSLYEIGEKIKAINEDHYQDMVKNARLFSGRISKGYYTKEAIDGIVAKLKAGENL